MLVFCNPLGIIQLSVTSNLARGVLNMTTFRERDKTSLEIKIKIKFKLFSKRLRVYTVEKEVAEGFRMRLTKGAGVVCGKSNLL